MSGTGHSYDGDVATSGNPIIDGLLSGSAWDDATLTISFPASGDEYVDYTTSEPDGIVALNATQEAVVLAALEKSDGNPANDGFSIEGFTALKVKVVTTDEAHIRVAQTSEDPFGYTTAWGGYPWWEPSSGDVWFHTEVYDYTDPDPGEHEHRTFLHELGHAMGLKHGHADEGTGNGTLPTAKDGYEYSVMTYRPHPGAEISDGYGAGSAPQSYMMADIAALQHMYGADFTTNSGNTTYSWAPGSGATMVNGGVAIDPAINKIFATVWDGGGFDTYDLSAYSTGVTVDLRPGMSSLFSDAQAADLGGGVSAKGNIYNALLYEDDPRSLIEAAIGGAGNDRLTGNDAANRLNGGGGRDVLKGLKGGDDLNGNNGNDKLIGGAGADDLNGGNGRDKLIGGGGSDVLNGGKGNDRLIGGAKSDTFEFAKRGGDDTVVGFKDNVDTLALNDNLWGGKSFSKQKVINKFASIEDGDLVFDFGAKGSITLLGFDDLDAIKDDLTIA